MKSDSGSFGLSKRVNVCVIYKDGNNRVAGLQGR